MLIKIYGKVPEGETRYSPPVCLGTKRDVILGDPDPEHISTSYVERSNLTIRMGNRRAYSPDQRLFKEGRKPRASSGAAFHVLQLRASASNAQGQSCDAGGGVSDHLWSVEKIAALGD